MLGFLNWCETRYKIVLDTDDKEYDGHGRLDHNTDFFTFPENWNARMHSMKVCTYVVPKGGRRDTRNGLNNKMSISPYHTDI